MFLVVENVAAAGSNSQSATAVCKPGRTGCDVAAGDAQPRGDAWSSCCRGTLGHPSFMRSERRSGGHVSEQVPVAVMPLEAETARMAERSVLTNEPRTTWTWIVADFTSLPAVADMLRRMGTLARLCERSTK